MQHLYEYWATCLQINGCAAYTPGPLAFEPIEILASGSVVLHGKVLFELFHIEIDRYWAQNKCIDGNLQII
ncbi:hypothetical protein SUGI_0181470 [Cryptomeria japonica]|nr:hypothetical protein SUGI_0181470 [Cryptomeria japonica]